MWIKIIMVAGFLLTIFADWVFIDVVRDHWKTCEELGKSSSGVEFICMFELFALTVGYIWMMISTLF